MEITRLTPFNALSIPADLWVLPSIKKSKWTQEIDYYIRFQITKAQSRVKSDVDPQLKKILENELVWEPEGTTQGPLMIVPQDNLPAKCILYLETPSETWLNQAYEVWKNLNRPSIKLFLPAGVKENDIQSQWKEFANLSFIEE